jgi:hypothetical protein
MGPSARPSHLGAAVVTVPVAACLREHGPLDLGEAVRRLDDSTRPVWAGLTVDSAYRLSAGLEQVGAAVVVESRP